MVIIINTNYKIKNYLQMFKVLAYTFLLCNLSLYFVYYNNEKSGWNLVDPILKIEAFVRKSVSFMKIFVHIFT